MHKEWLECVHCGSYWRGIPDEVNLCSKACAEACLEDTLKIAQDKESQAKPGRL
jgi:hypothetical protein